MSTTDELADDIEASDVDSDVDRSRKDESKRKKIKKKKVHRISGNLPPSSRNSGKLKDTDYLDDEEDETLISSLTFNDVRSKKKEKTAHKEEKTPRSPKKKKKKGKTESKTKAKHLESKDKKKKKKIEKSEEEIERHHKNLLEQALRRVSDRSMENPSEIFLVSGDSGVGKSHWIESETRRILQTIRRDESDNDSEETDEISEDDRSQFFPVVCRGTCEIPPRSNSAYGDDNNKNVGDSSTEALYMIGCGISRSPMHAITEALNDLIRSLMISDNFQEGIGEPEAMSNTSEIFGSKEVWKKRIEEALGTTEASHLASTGLVPELAVLLNLPGLRHVGEKKRIMQLWDWNTPYRFHRSCLAIRDLLRAITEYHHPVIMVIGNLHHADKDTYRLLNFLLTGCHWDEKYAAEVGNINDDRSEELTLISGAEAINSTATRLQNFLFVGLHEENSTTRNNMLHSLEYSFRRRKKPSFEENRNLAKTREQSPIHSHLTKICMEPFSIRRVGDVLCSTILNFNETKIRDEDETFDLKENLDELARIIYEWTGGNVFYVKQVFEYLKEEGAITLSSSRKLNMNKVQAQSRHWNNSTIGLIAARIVRQPKALRFVLINASVFRQTHLEFSVNELFHLFDAAYGQTKKGESGFPLESISELESALNLACDLGFMKRTTCRWNSNEKSHRWAFAHTMIRDEAYSLFAKKKIRKKMEIHLILGTKASALAFVPTSSEQEQDERSGDMSLSNVEYDTFKFLAADQLAIAEDILDQDYNRVAIMFVETAEMCILKSAFYAAIRYLTVGLGILERNGGCFTTENHGICLKSYLLLARLHAVCGVDTNETEKAFRKIAKNGKNLKDQIMLHQAEIGILMGKKNYQEALKRAMSSLELLGEILPQKVDGPKMISRQIENVIQETRRRDNQNLLQPAHCTEKKTFDLMTLLSNWIEISRLCESDGYQELATIRMMNICLISGFTPQYSMAFAHFGAILMERSFATNDSNTAKEGYRMGQICEKIACVKTFYGGHSLAIFHHYISHWRRPYRRSLGQILSIYNAQLESGDYFHINFTTFTYVQYHLASGHNLTKLDDNLQVFDVLYQDYSMDDHWKVHLPQRMVANLLGETPDPFLFYGNTIEDQDSRIQQMEKEGEHDAVQLMHFLRLFNSIFFHNHELSRYCLENIVEQKVMPIWRPWILFFRCFIDIIALGTTDKKVEKKKLKESINEQRDRLLDWYNQGAINCSVMVSLIDVEYMATDTGGKKSLPTLRMKKFYDDAVGVAQDQQLLHLEAFCLERASMRFEAAGADKLSAEYIAKAHQRYSEWNAIAKVDDIEEKHASKLKLSREAKVIGAGYVKQNSDMRYDPERAIGGGRKIKSINIKGVARKAEKVTKIAFANITSPRKELKSPRRSSVRHKLSKMNSQNLIGKSEMY